MQNKLCNGTQASRNFHKSQRGKELRRCRLPCRHHQLAAANSSGVMGGALSLGASSRWMVGTPIRVFEESKEEEIDVVRRLPDKTFLLDPKFSHEQAVTPAGFKLRQSSRFHYSRGVQLSRLWTSLQRGVHFLMQRVCEWASSVASWQTTPFGIQCTAAERYAWNSPRRRSLICQSISPLRNHEPSARAAETVRSVRDADPVIPY